MVYLLQGSVTTLLEYLRSKILLPVRVSLVKGQDSFCAPVGLNVGLDPRMSIRS